MRDQGARARDYFARGERLLPLLDRRARMCVSMLSGLYREILEAIEARDYDVLAGRVSLSTPAQARPDGPPHRLRAAVSRPTSGRLRRRPRGGRRRVEGAGLGAEVTLVERRPFLGGKAYSFTDPDTGREVDNGQHVFLGCCPAYIRLLRLLGTLGHTSLQRRLDAPVRDRAGRAGALRAAPAARARSTSGLSFAAYPHLSAGEKAAALRALAALAAMTERARRRLDGVSFADWLAERGQSPGARAAVLGPDRAAHLQRPQRPGLGGARRRSSSGAGSCRRREARRSAGRAWASRRLVDPAARDFLRGARRARRRRGRGRGGGPRRRDAGRRHDPAGRRGRARPAAPARGRAVCPRGAGRGPRRWAPRRS